MRFYVHINREPKASLAACRSLGCVDKANKEKSQNSSQKSPGCRREAPALLSLVYLGITASKGTEPDAMHETKWDNHILREIRVDILQH